MPGTSARSKASSPRPAMTERERATTYNGVITGLVPVIHVLTLSPQGRGWPGHRREATLRRLAAMTENAWDIGAKQSFVASPGHDGERTGHYLQRRHHRACPGDPRPDFVAARTWMAGTSARSNASSPPGHDGECLGHRREAKLRRLARP